VVSRPSEQTAGVFFLIFAAVCYAAAEAAVSQARLYRYGIEEALAVCSVGFLCAGMEVAFFSGSLYSPKEFLVPAAGVVFSLWIWLRFGLSYAFLAAMIFALFLPGYWTSSREAQRLIIAVFYAIGLAGVAAVRSRHRFDSTHGLVGSSRRTRSGLPRTSLLYVRQIVEPQPFSIFQLQHDTGTDVSPPRSQALQLPGLNRNRDRA
jgi:hypothetical protein